MLPKKRLEKLKRFIKACRVAKGMTQLQLSQQMNVPLKAIQKVEKTGVISTDHLFRILLVLNRNALNRMVDSALTIEHGDYPMADVETLFKAHNIANGRDSVSRRVK